MFRLKPLYNRSDAVALATSAQRGRCSGWKIWQNKPFGIATFAEGCWVVGFPGTVQPTLENCWGISAKLKTFLEEFLRPGERWFCFEKFLFLLAAQKGVSIGEMWVTRKPCGGCRHWFRSAQRLRPVCSRYPDKDGLYKVTFYRI